MRAGIEVLGYFFRSPLTLSVIAHCQLQLEVLFGLFHRGGFGTSRRYIYLFAIFLSIGHFSKHWPEQEQALVHDGRYQVIALNIQLDLFPGGPLSVIVISIIISVWFGALG